MEVEGGSVYEETEKDNRADDVDDSVCYWNGVYATGKG